MLSLRLLSFLFIAVENFSLPLSPFAPLDFSNENVTVLFYKQAGALAAPEC